MNLQSALRLQKQKELLNNIAKSYNIQKPSDWGGINSKILYKEGIYFKEYKGSVIRFLRTVYPETEWKDEWFFNRKYHPRGYWRKKENQREFLESFAKRNKLYSPRDWGNSSARKKLIEQGGISILFLYEGSLFKTLQNVFKEISWKREWFPSLPKYGQDYWKDFHHQRTFMLDIASTYGLKMEESDWKKISSTLIRNRGGSKLLSIYGNSVLQILNTLFPQGKWDIISNNQTNGSKNQTVVNSHLEQLIT